MQVDRLRELAHLAVARLLPGGAVDTTFAPTSVSPGLAEYDIGGAVFHTAGAVVDSLGRILVTGRTSNDETAVVRILADGAIDTSFASAGPTPGIFKKSYGANESVSCPSMDRTEFWFRVILVGRVGSRLSQG